MSGLELARHFDTPIKDSMAREEDKYPYHLPDGLQVSYEEKPSFPKARRLCVPRSTTFILSVALALVTSLAIVAAAVGGSLAAKNAHIFNSSCSIANTSASSPTDDCTKLSSTYVSSLSNNTGFNVSCNTAYHDHNILGVFVYRFEDCIEACASFNHFQSSNTTCLGVTFDLRRPQQGGKGNCFLKNFLGMNPTAMNGVSSAELL